MPFVILTLSIWDSELPKDRGEWGIWYTCGSVLPPSAAHCLKRSPCHGGMDVCYGPLKPSTTTRWTRAATVWQEDFLLDEEANGRNEKPEEVQWFNGSSDGDSLWLQWTKPTPLVWRICAWSLFTGVIFPPHSHLFVSYQHETLSIPLTMHLGFLMVAVSVSWGVLPYFFFNLTDPYLYFIFNCSCQFTSDSFSRLSFQSSRSHSCCFANLTLSYC